MLTFLQDLDTDIFLFFNGMHAVWLDQAMYVISAKWTWVPFYLILLWLMQRKFGWKQTLLGLVFIALAIALADQISASLIRPLVCRPRPANADSPIWEMVHVVNGYRGGHYGFPSCHAANSAALATFIVLAMRNRVITWVMVAWMLLLCYSRLYLGVHYPGDLLVGLIIGILSGVSCYRLFIWARRKIFLTL